MRRFFTILCYLGIFGGGIWFYQHNANFQSQVNQTVVGVQNLVARLNGQTTSKRQTTTATASSTDNSRWRKNSATIYIKMNNSTLQQAMEEAVANWNNTGVFTFTIVDNKKDADIVATTMSDDSDQAAGMTDMSINTGTGYFISGHVYLNSAYLLSPTYGYTHERIVNTAEHELGHAIGLSHTNAVSVMQPAGSNYAIQARDVASVKKLYATTPSTNTSSSQKNQ